MVPIEPWRNSTPFFGAVAFCTTKIDNLKTTCPCRSHIQRLHYPDFAAFLLFTSIAFLYLFVWLLCRRLRHFQLEAWFLPSIHLRGKMLCPLFIIEEIFSWFWLKCFFRHSSGLESFLWPCCFCSSMMLVSCNKLKNKLGLSCAKLSTA